MSPAAPVPPAPPAPGVAAGAPPTRTPPPKKKHGVRILVAILVIALVVSATGGVYYWYDLRAQAPGPAVFPSQYDKDVQHIFIIDQENRAFDSYFGTYCTTLGPYCSMTSIGTPTAPAPCEPYNLTMPAMGCVGPYADPPGMTMTEDIGHAWQNAHAAYNNGAMNGFLSALGGNPLAMGYYTNATIPLYWDWAEEYGLGDMFFSSAMSYSLPNHWLIVSGSAPNASYYGSNFTNPDGSISLTGTQYLDEANNTTTLADEMMGTSISWKYYDYALPPNTYNQAIANGSTWKYWNAYAAQARTYAPAMASHFVPNTQLFTDLAAGNAPNVSWVIGAATESEHPPYDILAGENWTASVVNAIEKSSIWNTSVIFLTWDDYGGFYDSVVPPQVNQYGYGFRVPLIVIGPYVQENYVDSTVGSFSSLVKFVEVRYNLPATGFLDGISNPLLNFFNFSQAPRAPLVIDVQAKGLQYPLPLQVTSSNMYKMDWSPPRSLPTDLS
jgi:phospholipase C